MLRTVTFTKPKPLSEIHRRRRPLTQGLSPRRARLSRAVRRPPRGEERSRGGLGATAAGEGREPAGALPGPTCTSTAAASCPGSTEPAMAAAALAPSNGTRWPDRTIRFAAGGGGGGSACQTAAEPALRLPSSLDGLAHSPPPPPSPRSRVVAAGPEGARRRAPWRRRGPTRWWPAAPPASRPRSSSNVSRRRRRGALRDPDGLSRGAPACP